MLPTSYSSISCSVLSLSFPWWMCTRKTPGFTLSSNSSYHFRNEPASQPENALNTAMTYLLQKRSRSQYKCCSTLSFNFPGLALAWMMTFKKVIFDCSSGWTIDDHCGNHLDSLQQSWTGIGEVRKQYNVPFLALRVVNEYVLDLLTILHD